MIGHQQGLDTGPGKALKGHLEATAEAPAVALTDFVAKSQEFQCKYPKSWAVAYDRTASTKGAGAREMPPVVLCHPSI